MSRTAVIEARPATLAVLAPPSAATLEERVWRLRERVVDLPSAGSCIVPHDSPLGQILLWQSLVLGTPLAPSGSMARASGSEPYYIVPLEVADRAVSASVCLMRHVLPPSLQQPPQARSE